MFIERINSSKNGKVLVNTESPAVLYYSQAGGNEIVRIIISNTDILLYNEEIHHSFYEEKSRGEQFYNELKTKWVGNNAVQTVHCNDPYNNP